MLLTLANCAFVDPVSKVRGMIEAMFAKLLQVAAAKAIQEAFASRK